MVGIFTAASLRVCGLQAFMGPAGIHSKLHVDIWHTDAWLCNLQGRKRFSVFHPAHKKYLQGKDDKWVDLSNPDMARYPEFNRAAPVEFVLEAGEMLYIPRKWPHAAVALEPSLSLSANFLAKCNKVWQSSYQTWTPLAWFEST